MFIHTCKTRGNGRVRFLASLVGEYPPQAPKHIRKTGWQRTFGAYTQDDYLNNIAFATMNGHRGTAEIDVDYLKIMRVKK